MPGMYGLVLGLFELIRSSRIGAGCSGRNNRRRLRRLGDNCACRRALLKAPVVLQRLRRLSRSQRRGGAGLGGPRGTLAFGGAQGAATGEEVATDLAGR